MLAHLIVRPRCYYGRVSGGGFHEGIDYEAHGGEPINSLSDVAELLSQVVEPLAFEVDPPNRQLDDASLLCREQCSTASPSP